MSKNIAVLDIGTTGIRVLAAKVNDGGLPHIIAKVAVPCRGLKKHAIEDRDALIRAIGQAVIRVQEQTGILVKSVYVGIQSNFIKFMPNTAAVDFSEDGQEVTYNDLANLLDKVASVDIYDDEVLLDVSPLKYVVNEEATVTDPIGLTVSSLRVDADVVLGNATYVNGIKECIEDAELSVDGFIPVSLAMAGLLPEYSDDAKSMLLVDVGGSVTDYTLFYKGKPYATNSVPVGGDNITNDLVQVFNISHSEAEALKRDYPLASSALVSNNIDIAVHSLETGEQEIIKIEQPVQVMQARIEDIFSLVAQNLSRDGINLKSVDRVIIAGDGISAFKGIDVICKDILGVQYLDIDFSRLTGMKSVYTYASGMVMYIAAQLPIGRKQSELEREYQPKSVEPTKKKGIFASFKEKLKDMLTGFRE